jgi:hypothetical protein
MKKLLEASSKFVYERVESLLCCNRLRCYL